MYPNSIFTTRFGSNLSQKGCLVLFMTPEKDRPAHRLRKCPVQRKMKDEGKRLQSTRQRLCDSFPSGNVGEGAFSALQLALPAAGQIPCATTGPSRATGRHLQRNKLGRVGAPARPAGAMGAGAHRRRPRAKLAGTSAQQVGRMAAPTGGTQAGIGVRSHGAVQAAAARGTRIDSNGGRGRSGVRSYSSPMMRAVRAAHSALARSRSMVGHCSWRPAGVPSAR